MFKRTLKLIAINAAVFLGLILLAEVAAQTICIVRPSYDVLFLQPDRVVGWKQVPNLRWTWAGQFWYAADFTVDVETNPLGFRDISRPVATSPGVKRIALLGDSFIEAIQVPLDKTAAHVLQLMLNARNPRPSQTWEALNFGVSNYGVGQYLLVWEQYARQFHPDYVTIFVAKLHMQRTVNKYEYGAFPKSEKSALWVRPTFRLGDGNLIREPAQDFDAFVTVQNELIRSDFSGSRSRIKKGLITPRYAKQLWSDVARQVAIYGAADSVVAENVRDAEIPYLEVNSEIIRELGRSVANSGARLIVIDASRYFGDDADIAAMLEGICRQDGLGYIPLYRYLQDANSNGVSTKWKHDYHFNEAGNEILASAVYESILRDQSARLVDTVPAGLALPAVRP